MESYGNIRIPWNGWRIESRLGSGSFGTVYEIVRDTYGTVEKSAMKVISVPENSERLNDLYSSGLDDESLSTWCTNRIENILKEYGVMNSLKGKANIVNCEDIEVVPHDNDPGADIFIRMELLTSLNKLLGIIQKKEDKLTDDEKETLRKLRPDHKEFTEEDVIRLGKDISQALEICEKNNIVHRDIKPENILISDDGDFKLGDFGTARKMEHTTAATLAGTERYMAPEVIKGGQTGRDVDTYSLGLVMYRLLNRGRFPFYPLTGIPTAEQIEEAQRRRLAGEPFDPPVDGSPELKALVMKACSYDRNDRFSSAAEMMEQIEEAEEILEKRADAAAYAELAKEEIPASGSDRAQGSADSIEDAWTDSNDETLGSKPPAPAEKVDEQIGTGEEKTVSDTWHDTDATFAKQENEIAETETSDTIDKFTVSDDLESKEPKIEGTVRNKSAVRRIDPKKLIIASVVAVLLIAAAVTLYFINNAKYEKHEWAGITLSLPSEWEEVNHADDINHSNDDTCRGWMQNISEKESVHVYISILDKDHNKRLYQYYFEDGFKALPADITTTSNGSKKVFDKREVDIDNTKCYLADYVVSAYPEGYWYHTKVWIPHADGKWLTQVEFWDIVDEESERTQEEIIKKVIKSIKITNDSEDNGFVVTANDMWTDTKRVSCDGISFEVPSKWSERDPEYSTHDMEFYAEYNSNSDIDITVDTDDYAYSYYEKDGDLLDFIDDRCETDKKNYDVSEIENGKISIGGKTAYFISNRYNWSMYVPETNLMNYRYKYDLYIPFPDRKQVTHFEFSCRDKGIYTERDKQLFELIKNSISISD